MKIMMDEKYYKELLRKDAIFRFVRDIGTQEDGNIYLPANYCSAAEQNIDELVDKIFNLQIAHAEKVDDMCILEEGYRV